MFVHFAPVGNLVLRNAIPELTADVVFPACEFVGFRSCRTPSDAVRRFFEMLNIEEITECLAKNNGETFCNELIIRNILKTAGQLSEKISRVMPKKPGPMPK